MSSGELTQPGGSRRGWKWYVKCLGLVLPEADWRQVFKQKKSFIWHVILGNTSREGGGCYKSYYLCRQLQPGLQETSRGQLRTGFRLSQQGFYPPGLQRRRCQHTDGVQVVNPQYLFLGYYPGDQNCGAQLDIGARATGAFLALVRIGLEIGVSLWGCVCAQQKARYDSTVWEWKT